MNITTQDFDAHREYIRIKILSSKTSLAQIDKYQQETERIELDSVSNKTSICSLGETKKVENYPIDYSKLNDLKEGQFYNYSVMDAVGCAVDAVFFGLPATDGDIARLANLKDHVRGIKKFGAESVSGNALRGKIDGQSDLYVIKTPRTQRAESDLTHELFVGLNSINKLRKLVPNFAMVFGGFKCSKPNIDPETNEVISFCSDDLSVDKVQYVVYESISPSKGFDEYILDCTVEEFYEFYIQHLYATQTAANEVGYTHYDSHNQNWLAREVNGDKFCIEYKDYRSGNPRFVTASVVATAIDYGMTNVLYEGREMGPADANLMQYGVEPGPWPMHDAYKLLMFSADTLLQTGKNPAVLKEIQKIFAFFNKTEDFRKAVKIQREFYYGLPRFEEIEDLTLYDLLDYIEEHCDVSNILTNKPTKQLLQCTTCNTFSSTLKSAIPRFPKPKTFFEFYDLATHLASEEDKYKMLVKSFDYTSAAILFKQRVGKDLGEFNASLDYLRDMKYPQLARGATVSTLADKTMMNTLSKAYLELLTAVSMFEDITLWLKVGQKVAELYYDKDMQKYIADVSKQINRRKKDIGIHISEQYANYRVIRDVLLMKEWAFKQSKYPWYSSVLSQIVYMRDRFDRDIADSFVAKDFVTMNTDKPRKVKDRGLIPANRRVIPQRDQNNKIVSVVYK